MKHLDFENSIEYDLSSSPEADRFIADFEFISLLSETETSSIHIIRHKETLRIYTLKAMRKIRGVIFDFSSFQNLNHENIASLIVCYETKHYYYVVKEYVEGITLQQWIKDHHTPNFGQLNALIQQLISAMKYLHNQQKPIIFRDLKPSNIIVCENTQMKIVIIDTETMRLVKDHQSSDTYYVMSHGFSSPEQYGYSQTDVRSDIYSLGATLYYVLTGEKIDPSVRRQSPSKTRIPHTIISRNPGIKKEVAVSIEKCLEFDPNKRFQTVEALEKAIFREKDKGNWWVWRGWIVLSTTLVILILTSTWGYRNVFDNSSLEEATIVTTQSIDIPKTPLSAFDLRPVLLTEEATTVAKTEPTSEPTTELVRVNKTAMQPNDQNVSWPTPQIDVSKVVHTRGAVTLAEYSQHPNYLFVVDRNWLPENERFFKYVSVLSFDLDTSKLIDSDELSKIVNGAIQNIQTSFDGLTLYDDKAGYRAYLKNDHFLLMLFDESMECIGYSIFYDVHARLPLEETLQVPKTIDLDPGVKLVVVKDYLTLHINKEQIPADIGDFKYVSIISNLDSEDPVRMAAIMSDIDNKLLPMFPYSVTGNTSGFGPTNKFDGQPWTILLLDGDGGLVRVYGVEAP